jgi:multiple sugar transport system ATP-binding protein
MNFLAAEGGLPAGAREIRVKGAQIRMPETREALYSHDAVLGARPEHITRADDGPLRGEVFAVEYMGARQMITVDTPAGRLRVRAPNTLSVDYGETVGLAFDAERLVVFNGESDRAVASTLFEQPLLQGGVHG